MENEVLNALMTRRSVRRYKAEQVPDDLLDAVLKAGTYAPSGMGRQAARIVVIQKPELREKVMKLNAAILGADTDPYYGAPTILLVFASKTRATYIEDGSCVLDNLQLAAHAVGLASCWIHRERQMFETKEGRVLARSWGLSDDEAGVGSIALGYAADALPAPAPRKSDYIVRT